MSSRAGNQERPAFKLRPTHVILSVTITIATLSLIAKWGSKPIDNQTPHATAKDAYTMMKVFVRERLEDPDSAEFQPAETVPIDQTDESYFSARFRIDSSDPELGS